MRIVPVYSPFTGRVIPLEDVPDPVFSAKMLGDGLAVLPETDQVVAPISGKLTVLHSAGHAFAVQAHEAPVTVLVHIGLDTVKLKGVGFKILTSLGDQVTLGQPVVQVDREAIEHAGYSLLSPVILPDLPEGIKVELTDTAKVVQGVDVLLNVVVP
ncbi:MAG TPA: PTS glucose transporter subunit IIA [Anaerolineales bacterium]